MLECFSVARHYRGVKRVGKPSTVFIMYVKDFYFSALLSNLPIVMHQSQSARPVHAGTCVLRDRDTVLIGFLQFQYGVRSNQLAATAQRAKPRRVCRQQILTQAPRPFVPASANCRGDNRRPKTMPAKLIRISDSPNGNRQPNNVARTIVRSRDFKTTGDGVSSPEMPYVNCHPQAIRNYLNQTVPLLTQQHPRARNRIFCRGRDNPPVDRSFAVTDNVATTNNRVKSAARDQGNRLHARHSFDVGYVGERRSTTTCDKSRYLNSHSQSHGVIAESLYKDLCNGTIGW